MIPYGDMVFNYYRAIADEAGKKRAERLAAIKTKADAEAEVAAAKKRLQKAFGEFPERCPLEPVVTGIVNKDGVRVEKVLIQVRPGMHATVAVYRSADADPAAKQPVILLLGGHNANGKAAGNGQRLKLSLARAGFTAASIDPIGQGERYQYDLGTPNPVRQHNLAGKMLMLEGEFFGMWRLHDARCALDYLLTRDDIDMSRVGVCGTSGGGTLSSYLFALDERIHAAAPACYLTTFRRNFLNELPCDSEQIPPGLWADGGDMADFIIARAPAPAILLEVENDFFDVRGTRESFNEAEKIYSLLGKAENCRMYVGPGSHCLSPELRRETFDFFTEVFFKEKRDYETFEPWADEELFVTANGSVLDIPGEKTICRYIEEKAAELKAGRNADASGIEKFLKESFAVTSDDCAVPEYRHGLGEGNDGFALSEFTIETDRNCEAVLHVAEADLHHFKKYENVTLYVSHLDAASEMSSVDCGTDMLMALDVRGIGKSRPLGCSRREDYFDYYDSDFFFDSTGKLLDTSYLAGKIRDLRKTVALIRAHGCKNLTIKAHGLGSLVTLFALGIDNNLADRVRLTGLPSAYGDFTCDKDVRWPQSHMIPGMLAVFDIPELCAVLKERIDFDASGFLDRMMQ